jgi:FAD/FMN-containing dehydrogenase
MTLDAARLGELRELLGDDAVTTDAAELRARTRDCWPLLTMRERAGETLPQPAVVVWPRGSDQAAALYRWASQHRIPVVPFGGGAGVTGGSAPVAGCVMVDTKRMAAVVGFADVSGIVTVQPGMTGQALEEWLGARGWTLGHFPSSITVSSVGGFAAARSAGQASTKYGKFEAMVCGLEAVLADGTLVRIRPRAGGPARARRGGGRAAPRPPPRGARAGGVVAPPPPRSPPGILPVYWKTVRNLGRCEDVVPGRRDACAPPRPRSCCRKRMR